MSVKVQIEDFVAPEKAPHPMAGIVQQLIDAGPDKVATAVFKTEDEAKAFLRDMQAAAREVGMSATKRIFTDLGKDGWKVGVNVRDKITRERKAKAEVSE